MPHTRETFWTEARWAALIGSAGLVLTAINRIMVGDYTAAATALTGAFGTGILPGMLGRDWEIQIVKKEKLE